MATVPVICPTYEFTIAFTTNDRHTKTRFSILVQNTFMSKISHYLSTLCKKDIGTVALKNIDHRQNKYTCRVRVNNDISGMDIASIKHTFIDAGNDIHLSVSDVKLTGYGTMIEFFDTIDYLNSKIEELQREIENLKTDDGYNSLTPGGS